MINEKEILEGYLNEMQAAHSQLVATKKGLYDIALSPFEPVFELDLSGSTLLEHMGKNELLELKNSFENDLLPMFEEGKYKEGIEKINKWQKLVDKNLEKQK
jgi:hypothetical protein